MAVAPTYGLCARGRVKCDEVLECRPMLESAFDAMDIDRRGFGMSSSFSRGRLRVEVGRVGVDDAFDAERSTLTDGRGREKLGVSGFRVGG
jgi:hypothetical protein